MHRRFFFPACLVLVFTLASALSSFAQAPTTSGEEQPHPPEPGEQAPRPAGQAPAVPPVPVLPSGPGQIVNGVHVTPKELKLLAGYQPCVPKDQAGYRNNTCKIEIWRTNPITPPTMSLPRGTNVYIVLYNARQNENVTFTLATTRLPPHDIGAAALQSAIPGLQTIIATQPLQSAAPAAPQAPGQNNAPQIMNDQTLAPQAPPQEVQALMLSLQQRQTEIAQSTNSVLKAVQDAAAAMTCLSNYEVLDESGFQKTCSQANMLQYDDFSAAKTRAMALTTAATVLPLRVVDVSDLDTVVKSFYLTCLGYFPQMAQNENIGRTACRSYSEQLSTQEALLDKAISDTQAAQDTLIQNVQTLRYWGDTSKRIVIFEYTAPQNTTMQVTIAGTEVVSKVSTTVAVVTINANATPWVVSSGISFSTLKSNSYAPVPAYANGAPVTDSSGVAEVTVGGTSTDFSVVAPLFLMSYRVNLLSRANWEIKCPNSCAFLLSTGGGANLSSKSVDFDAGPSFQIGSVLITPTVHWGRDTRLSGGFYVNEPLGADAPTTLPTQTAWVTKAAIALTYAIPIP